MPNLADAKAVYIGEDAADRIYRGSQLIWERPVAVPYSLVVTKEEGAGVALSGSLTDDPNVLDWIYTRYWDRKAGANILPLPTLTGNNIGSTACHAVTFTDGTPTASRTAVTAAYYTSGNYSSAAIDVTGRIGSLMFYTHNNNTSRTSITVNGFIAGVQVETKNVELPSGGVCGRTKAAFHGLDAITYTVAAAAGNIKFPLVTLRDD
jgi:hypothetical protein